MISGYHRGLQNIDYVFLAKRLAEIINLLAFIREQVFYDIRLGSGIPSDVTRGLISQLIELIDKESHIVTTDVNGDPSGADLATNFALKKIINCRQITFKNKECLVIDMIDNVYTLADFAVGGKGEYSAAAYGGYQEGFGVIDYLCCLYQTFVSFLNFANNFNSRN